MSHRTGTAKTSCAYWATLCGCALCLILFPVSIWFLEAHAGYSGRMPRWVLAEPCEVSSAVVFWLTGLGMLPLAVASVHLAQQWRRRTKFVVYLWILAWIMFLCCVALWAAFGVIFVPSIEIGLGI